MGVMAHIKDLNAHDRPPEVIRQLYKKYAKLPISNIELDAKIVDTTAINPESPPDGISVVKYMSGKNLRRAFDDFMGARDAENVSSVDEGVMHDIPVLAHKTVSGQFRLWVAGD